MRNAAEIGKLNGLSVSLDGDGRDRISSEREIWKIAAQHTSGTKSVRDKNVKT